MILFSIMLTNCVPPPSKPGMGKAGQSTNKGETSGATGDNTSGSSPSIPDAASTKGGVDTVLGDGPSACDTKQNIAGKKLLRLLTKSEYSNSLRDVLKLTRDPTGLLPAENAVNGFINNTEQNIVTADHLSGYLDIAIAVADETKAKLSTLAGCTEDAGASCAQKVIDTIAPKLYHRPLTQAEKDLALRTYNKGVDTREKMTLLIASLLTSPNFLYRSEIGNTLGDLDPYEIASAISYFFWGTVPDDAIAALAASGKLASEDVITSEALRYWKDPRSRFVSDQFAHGWLENQSILSTSKDPSLQNIFTPEIQKAMVLEAEDTLEYLLKQNDASFEKLFTNDFTIGGPALAAYYKGKVDQDAGVSKIKFPGTSRKGMLTLGSIMASHSRPDESHPIKRGDFILKKMLCYVSPPTPKGLDVTVPAKDPTKTTRERFAIHSTSPACASCHIKLDGIGFGMEDYDTLGIFRDKENGVAIDASGTMIDVDGTDIKFNGGGDLSEEMAKTSQAKRCFTLQWYRYAHGRTMVATDSDICATRNLATKFSKGEVTLGDLLVKIITDTSYLKRDH